MGGRFALKARDHVGVPERKRRFNELHFQEAAPRYGIATRAMSLGRDGAWKRALVSALPDWPAPSCVDLACGTGDVAFLLAARYPLGSVAGLDIAPAMLAIAGGRNRFPNVRFERGDMGALSYPDASADIVTAGYALRNAPDLRIAIAEVRRVLRPGGVFAILDFSKPGNPVLQRVQYFLLRGWCGLWGILLHGTPEIHGYVAESIKVFPDRRRFLEILWEEGFALIASRRFFLGITEILVLRRLPPSGATGV